MTDVTDATDATDATEQVGVGGATEAPTRQATLLRSLEIDTRLLGMLGAVLVIWIAFHIWSGGTFLTPRNLWNLTVQTSAVAIMATGMVLVIVTRNIDLSVGSMLAVIGMAMALLQAEILPDWLGFDHWATWIIALLAGIALGAVLGAFQGAIIAYVGVPSFIVTLGGLLAWRGVAWWMASGRTIAPMDSTFQLLGGGARGNIGGTWSWVVGIVACVGIITVLVTGRRRRLKFGFALRPNWASRSASWDAASSSAPSATSTATSSPNALPRNAAAATSRLDWPTRSSSPYSPLSS